MVAALWIIAVCEIFRALQNFVQIEMVRRDLNARGNLYAEFIKSLKQDDREFVKRLLDEYERTVGNDGK